MGETCMIRILIVEDELPISDVIRWNLTKAGYECVCAYDGMQAADILEEQNFDLILLDVMLPHIDGYELMEYIKPMGIPVIFLTAKSALDNLCHIRRRLLSFKKRYCFFLDNAPDVRIPDTTQSCILYQFSNGLFIFCSYRFPDFLTIHIITIF